MINLKLLKDTNIPNTTSLKSSQKKKSSVAHLRAQKDISDLVLPNTCKEEFPDPDDLLNFNLIISPDEGTYKGGRFNFSIQIGQNYPYQPPKVKCLTKIYHPNIDLEGNVCLNILREDWRPILTINVVVYGILFLFLEPNPEDPLNKEAAEEMISQPSTFVQNVNRSMRGYHVHGVHFESCLIYKK